MRRLLHYVSLAASISLLLAGCAARPPASSYPRVETHAFENTSDTKLAKAYAPLENKHPGLSGFHLLNYGPEALMMRIALVESAERSIDMQYFSTRDDTTGGLLLEAIYRAAKRGVRVRMLLDDWNLDDFEAGAVALNADPHIEIRVFNPYSTRDQSIFSRIGNASSYLGHFNHRMHNKALIVDNQVSIVGGRNLGDEYFDADQELNLRDIDVFVAGPASQQISKNFDRYWNSEESFPVAALNLPKSDEKAVQQIQNSMAAHWKLMLSSPIGAELEDMPLPHKAKKGNIPLIWANSELTADNPAKAEMTPDQASSAPEKHIGQLANKAQHEFIIFTPYFVPLDDGVEWLASLVKRGVRVRVLTNSLSSTDMVPAQAGYSHYREALVKSGVELYEIKSIPPKSHGPHMFKPSSQNGLHAKIYMIDREDLIIGSFNFDQRSIKYNTEQALIIHSPELSDKIAHVFEDLTSLDSSYKVVPGNAVPASKTGIFSGALAWETEEEGKIVYYDFNPHAGFWRTITNGFFSILPIDNEL